MSSQSRFLSGAAWLAFAISPVLAADRGALPAGSTRLAVQTEQAVRVQKLGAPAPAATTSAAKELVPNVSRAYPASCFSDALPQTVNSLPATPSGTLYGGTVTLYAVNNNTSPATASTEDVTITIFRVPCSSSGDKLAYNPDGGPVSATLMRIQRQAQYDHDAKYYPVFPGVRVSQGSIGFDNASYLDYVRIAPEPNTVVSDTLIDSSVTDSVTYVLENYPYQGTGFFDFNNAFSIRFDNFITGSATRQVVFNIPAYNPTSGTYPAAFAPLPINGYLTGSWYDPTHSGEGILTQVFDAGDAKTRIFAMTWYTFDNTGLPFWLFGTAQFNIGATSISGMKVYYRTGGGFAGNFTPGFPQPQWGTMNVSFTDCNHMVFSYNGTGPSSGPSGQGQKTWQRIGSINSLACQ